MFKRGYGLIAALLLLITTSIATTVNPVRANAAPVAFQQSLKGTMAAGTEGLNLTFTVPAGKQLVIEYVAGNCFVPSGQACVLSIFTQVGASAIQFNVETNNVGPFGGGNDLWRAGQVVRLYANSGTIVTLRADRNSPTGTANVTFMSISGYLH